MCKHKTFFAAKNLQALYFYCSMDKSTHGIHYHERKFETLESLQQLQVILEQIKSFRLQIRYAAFFRKMQTNLKLFNTVQPYLTCFSFDTVATNVLIEMTEKLPVELFTVCNYS